MSTLEIGLLGELEVAFAGKKLALPASKKTRALLGFLVATARPHSRERLCEFLWQGPDDPRAALRWSLTKIRGLLDTGGVARVVADRERVGFESVKTHCDLTIVKELLGRGAREADLDALRAAAARFRGELLEGLDLPDCYGYHEWCVGEREAARALRVSTLGALVERLSERASDRDEALTYARQRVAIDPLAEAAHVAIVRLLTDLGKKREALQQYETCRRILQNELGTKPSAALLAARVKVEGSDPPPAPAHAVVADSVPAPSAAFVGRGDISREIRDVVGAATEGRPSRVVLIAGEPGIGKTRVLDELASAVRAAGGQALRGRAFEAEMVRPYGAWIDALRSVQLGSAVDAHRAHLAPLLPELGTAAPGGEGGGDRNHLFDAVAQLLARLSESTVPLAIVLDDIQWLDEASAALFSYVARALASSRIVLACGARSFELGDNVAALRLVRALQREARISEHELAPLDADDVAALARSVHPGIDVDRVVRESSGNPLFAMELARAVHRGGPGGRMTESLSGLIRERLARLDEGARELVPWAAALGHAFGLDTLARVTGTSPAELVAALEELERRGIIRTSASRGGVGYAFVHDLIRAGAYRQLSEPRRRWVHLRIARALREMSSAEAGLAGEIAHHAALGGDSELAARACIDAGERSLQIFASDEAAKLAEIGIQHASRLSADKRVPMHIAFLRVKVLSGAWLRRRSELASELGRVVIEAQNAGLHADAATGFHYLSVLQHDAGDMKGAHASTLCAEDEGRSADPVRAAQQLSDTARCLALIEKEMDRVTQLIGEARPVLDAHGIEELSLHWAEALLHCFTGDHARAAPMLERSLKIARRSEDRWAECDCLMRLVQMELERGRPAAALARCRELAPVAAKMGEGTERPAADALEALSRVFACVPGADEHLARALDGLREIDAKGMLAYVLVFAAELELEARRLDGARAFAEEALRAAAVVDRRSQVALARAVLARVALAGGDHVEAARCLGPASADAARSSTLSARAVQAVERVQSELSRS